jgi:hypothetical protein
MSKCPTLCLDSWIVSRSSTTSFAARAVHGDGDKYPYLDMTTLARYLISTVASSSSAAHAALFERVESLMVHGSTPVRNLVVTGLFVDLQNLSMRSNIEFEFWEKLLGVESLVDWQALIDVWSGKISGDWYNRLVDAKVRRRSEQ